MHIQYSLGCGGGTSASGVGSRLTGSKATSCGCAVQLPRYHARFNFHLMVSMCSALLHARNAMLRNFFKIKSFHTNPLLTHRYPNPEPHVVPRLQVYAAERARVQWRRCLLLSETP